MKLTKKIYLNRLKKNCYKDLLEPHFYYYQLIKVLGLFKTIFKEQLSKEDFTSAIYGKFVCEGKPIIKGFYNHYNLTLEILGDLLKHEKEKKKNKKLGK